MLTEEKGKPVCLLWGDSVLVMKEYNIKRHCERRRNTHTKKNTRIWAWNKSLRINRKSKSQQAMFTETKTQSEAAVRTSYIVVEDLAKAARSFTEGEFVKHCMLKICGAVCPEKKAAIF